MRTSNVALALALFAALVGAPACAEDDGAPGREREREYDEDAASESEALASGVSVRATHALVVTGTPTYGDDATEPVLRVEVEVDDAEVRRQHPGFDGFEQVFVLIPKRNGEGVTWHSSPLAWKGTTGRGYFGQTWVDVHQSEPVFGVDVATLEAEGVAVGLTTNVGTLWAQAPGQNHPVTPR